MRVSLRNPQSPAITVVKPIEDQGKMADECSPDHKPGGGIAKRMK